MAKIIDALRTQVLPSTLRSTLVPYAFVRENALMLDYSDTNDVNDMKVGI